MHLENLRLAPLAVAAALAVSAAGCGSDDKSCSVAEQTGCGSGLVCEAVEGGAPACVQPLVIRGSVFDLETAAPVENARVVALDVNRAPVSTVAITDALGEFSVQVANPRTRDGAAVARDVFLRADAQGYATFPSGIRSALPVNTGGAVKGDRYLEVSDPQTTDIGLIALDAAGTGIISGTVSVPANQPGALVVAEPSGATALADRNGDYAIFNLAPGDHAVRAYARGVVHEEKLAAVVAGAVTDVDLAMVGRASGAVSGQVQIVNPGSGKETSVILVVESTFDEGLERGETPPGLRAPETGAPTITGAWELTGVPPGRYVALAAFENDLLVRDPDQCISGTEIQHLEVLAGAPTPSIDFKVTGALDILSPGAAGPELLTTATPTLAWEDDSSEDSYELTIVDALGTLVHEALLPGASGQNPQYTVPAPLEPGYYQFKVKSSKDGCYLSQTEDLKGVFVVPAAP